MDNNSNSLPNFTRQVEKIFLENPPPPYVRGNLSVALWIVVLKSRFRFLLHDLFKSSASTNWLIGSPKNYFLFFGCSVQTAIDRFIALHDEPPKVYEVKEICFSQFIRVPEVFYTDLEQ